MTGQRNRCFYYSCGLVVLTVFIALFTSNTMATESVLASQVAIPDAVRAAFQGGLSLPVTVNTSGDNATTQDDNIAIGLATIALQGDNFNLVDINVEGGKGPYKVVLSATAKAQLLTAKGKALSSSGWLVVSPDIKLHLNPLTMHLELVVSRTFFGVTTQQRETLLPTSTVRDMTSLLQYDLNAYTSRYQGVNSQSAYLNFQSQSALGEHHLDVEGAVLAGDEQSIDLNKAMYEYDANGHRLAAGMLDSWSMQALGNVSTLNSSRIYGLSYGNASQSVKVDGSQSLSPIVVYFPSAGEARIFRDDRLLSVQRVSMGNHQLDTARLPSGVYDVRVDVVVGGRVISSRLHHVNKMGASQKYGDGLGWQIWGGVIENRPYHATGDEPREDGFTPIGGVSLASYWKDINWNLSLYQTDYRSVEEGLATWQATNELRFDLQNLYSSDTSDQWMARVSYDLPDGLGSVWGYRQRGTDGDKLPFYAQSYDSAGLSLNLGYWVDYAGSLNVSYEEDKRQHQQYVRTDYNQMVYSGRYGSAQLQLGMTGSDFSGSDQQYYATLNFSLPWSADFQIGLSQQGAQRELDLQAGKSFDGGFINYAGANVSTVMLDGVQNTNYGAFADYAGRYGQGTLSYNGSQGSSSLSLSNHGAFALTHSGIAAGSGSGDAALIVDMPEIKTGDLEVVMDNQAYPLSSGRNLIPVTAYNTYQVNVRSSELAASSYQIASSDQQEYTLYPGNVGVVKPEIKQMVTVFGQLIDSRGQPLMHAKINNHIGITTSDENGNFAVDVDKHHPQVIVQLADNHKFEVNMNLKNDDGTKWLGTVQWFGKDIRLEG